MEKRIAENEAKLFNYIRTLNRWFTIKEIMPELKIPDRTMRHYLGNFVNVGLCQVMEVFPGKRYVLVSEPGTVAQNYALRLEKTFECFNLK